ncbi:hypothetical protein PHLGIDRAFT_158030 [Phlebiopsis gigantea 11061_1 CR5-6]|uniref:Uncharacterized protein n=1 Tax=Phlebiopsis gigantea (strain 11061_1 CR5-6) TaxID=745531 RepID=A0A0C3P0A6_PHLG1|nr:hypothetical protein PHLGIDRAFT_158030 [Phlebiopsis gigantea 11061_1 CR5-6]
MQTRSYPASEIHRMRREQSIVQLPQDKARALDPSPGPTTFVLLHEKHSAVYIGVPSANLVLYAGSARDSESDVDGELIDGTIQSRIAADVGATKTFAGSCSRKRTSRGLQSLSDSRPAVTWLTDGHVLASYWSSTLPGSPPWAPQPSPSSSGSRTWSRVGCGVVLLPSSTPARGRQFQRPLT